MAAAVPALLASLLAISQATLSMRALATTLHGTTLAALFCRQLEIGSSLHAVGPDELQGGCSCVWAGLLVFLFKLYSPPLPSVPITHPNLRMSLPVLSAL